jgi:hypothetical protein
MYHCADVSFQEAFGCCKLHGDGWNLKNIFLKVQKIQCKKYIKHLSKLRFKN